MKEIDSQLYGLSYELDTTSEDDGTKCYAVDTGTVFVAYKGVWYEQPGSFWAASISPSDDDILGLSYEVNKITPDSDLTVFNAVDTGQRFISFNGAFFAQPVTWSAPAAGGGGSELPAVTSDDNGDVLTVVEGAWGKADPPAALPSVTSDDNGDVLTVVSGAWAKAAPSGGGDTVIVNATASEDFATMTLDKTWREIYNGNFSIIRRVGSPMGTDYLTYFQIANVYNDEMAEGNPRKVVAKDVVNNITYTFTTASGNGYPVWTSGG